ncbi:hypothetical protein EXIGLDRAFT_715920 [Exidia glandulosa HHB12029]|uniref:BZIP domain-containing protein n=1 Tax=Exidia glandulosa HHB12029 TaxID=1314781 RepID=A0A165QNY2_EXIGL|nr:hypothetical protein EXIGLDRAFT_715920 [Exidia glandulosa HHB12029]
MPRTNDNDDDSGDDSMGEMNETGTGSKPGRKKNPNSQAARRDQNRIAQREFRLRKQQRIRDLEARVELLSGNQDETFNYMRAIVKDLIHENSTLRGLVKNLSQFIGEGLPQFLPRMGWDMGEFQDFLNKTDTDTAIDSFTRLKRQSMANSANQKRTADDNQSGANKRAKTTTGSFGAAAPSSSRGSFSAPAPPSPTLRNAGPRGSTGSDLFTGAQEALSFSAMFDLPFTSNSPLIIPAVPGSSQAAMPFPQASTSTQRDLFSGGLPSMDLRPRSAVSGLPTLESSSLGLTTGTTPSSTATSSTPQPFPDPSSSEEDSRKQEAFKLIHYHLENYRRNPQYHLPTSLRPSLIQRTIPHDTVIDGIPLPELRDRMILFKGRYDLAGCVFSFGQMGIVHGDDVLSQNNWELGRGWLQQYGFLVDQGILNITNRWRAERGEPEILMSELGISEPTAEGA